MVKVDKETYLLCRELERLEDVLNFTVFYPFAEILESHHKCPAFTFKNVYYEVQYDNENCLRVVDFGVREWKDEGDILTTKEIESLKIELMSTGRKDYYVDNSFATPQQKAEKFGLIELSKK